MSRFDVFDEVYSGHIFINLFNRTPDESLRPQWNSLSEKEQFPYLAMVSPKAPHLSEKRRDNATKVGEYYAFRLQDQEFRQFPAMMQRILLLTDDSDISDVLYLSTLGAISCCLPNYSGSLLGEEVIPNLFVLMTGPAATGKGKAALAHKLIEPLDKGCPLFVAGNSSATAMYELLHENGGRGLIFETELDTLTQAFKIGGDFSEGLRKAFHNEKISYQRRTRHERVNIPHPILSMVLTGTPGQVPKILKSAENGLFSRFLYYRLSSRRESFVELRDEAMHITGEMVNDYMLSIGEEVKELVTRMAMKREGIRFMLTAEQHDRFMEHFHNLSQTYGELMPRVYDYEQAGDDIESVVRRMGNICYRMMMLLGAMRLAEVEEIPDTLECNEDDFNTILIYSEMLMHHTMVHYDEMLQATGIVGDGEDEPNMDSEDLMNERQRMFWNALPKYFIKKEAVDVANQQSLSIRSVNTYLNMFCEMGILEKVKRGAFNKVDRVDDEEDESEC